MVILSDLLRRKTKLNTENFFCPAVDFQFNYIVTSVFIIVVNNIQLKVNQEVLTVFEFSKPPRIVCALSRLFFVEEESDFQVMKLITEMNDMKPLLNRYHLQVEEFHRHENEEE